MTNDELDNLASAYVDGEVTAEEVALVESDPVLLRRVAVLRSVSAAVAATPPPAPVSAEHRQAQIAAAMAGFGSVSGGGEVIDLAERRRSGSAAQTAGTQSGFDSSSAGSASPPPSPSLGQVPSSVEPIPLRRRNPVPTWVGVAAAFALFVGGFAALARNLDNNNETAAFDSADAAFDADSTDGGAAQGDAMVDDGLSTAAESAPALADSAGGNANEDTRAGGEAFDLADEQDEAADRGDASREEGSAASMASTSIAELESTAAVDSELIDLFELEADPTVPWQPVSEAYCQTPVGFEVNGELAGVFVIEQGEMQVMVYTPDGLIGSPGDDRTLILVDGDCTIVDTNI